ncbi:hypothetical protein BJY01DRAFT_244674 [Aspergillus pseudoustus]|uniref:RHS repeat protein n=1 Tax=Aspergillus pseudoustus TaxID=1810923 RepID=A0ABR4KLH2_9EURO
MTEAGDYPGSQAYAHIVGSGESINRNTGSLNYSTPLLHLRGKVKEIDLRLDLRYTVGLRGLFGLPRNWSFSINYVVPNRSATLNGRTYAIDGDWADQGGYQSGLRYVNNHSIKFELIVPPQPLPSGNPGKYEWRFRNVDGAVDYFDGVGKLLEHHDRFGNHICYRYKNSEEPAASARLDYIVDSWGQKIHFGELQSGGIQITTPDKSTIRISCTAFGVEKMVDPVGATTVFSYTQELSQYLLAGIQHPSSLISGFSYQAIPCWAGPWSKVMLPAVRDHYHKDSNGQKLDHTTYTFNETTFTGFASNYRIGGRRDSLMDGNDKDYRYEVVISRLDAGTGKTLAATKCAFNYLHLAVEEVQYGVDGDGHLRDAYKVIYSYSIDPNQHARSTNYCQPRTTEHRHYQPQASPVYQPMRRTQAEYNRSGYMLWCVEDIWSPEKGAFVPQGHTEFAYATGVKWGGDMLKEETSTDRITGTARKIMYTFTDDDKAVARQTMLYREANEPAFKPWKVLSFDHDAAGRTVKETVAWADPSLCPPLSVSEYSSTTSYGFEVESGTEIVRTTDPLGNTTVTKSDLHITDGPVIERALPGLPSQTYAYDSVGRCTRATDALGNTTAFQYAFEAPGSTMMSTNATGYIQRHDYDPFGREVKLSDNGGGDGSEKVPGSMATRALSTTGYDSLARKAWTADEHGLKTTFEYDALSREVRVTDPDGNVTETFYDDQQLRVEQKLNGDRRREDQMDGFGRTLSSVRYPDSGDYLARYALVQRQVYDGSHNVLEASTLEQPLDGSPSTMIETTMTTYGADGKVSSRKTRARTDLANGGWDTATRQIQRDIFGNEYTTTKNIEYHDGSMYRHDGAINLFDSCNRLAVVRNQLEEEERYGYDPSGRRTRWTRYDGTVIEYMYDVVGQQTAIGGGAPAKRFSYLQNGRLASSESDGALMGYQYAIDGTSTSIRYPNNVQQDFTLDPMGRITKDTDVHGMQRTIVFDQSNRVASQSMGPDMVTYHYGDVNHAHGQLLGDTTAGPEQTLTRSISYDGFGRPRLVTVSDHTIATTVLRTSYTYNSKGRISCVKTSSQLYAAVDGLNSERKFQYDGLGQLRTDTVTYATGTATSRTSYTYDGNSNIVSVTTGEQTEHRRYNAIDQRTDHGYVYDTNGRLIHDPEGRTYVYDATDRLLSVENPAGVSRFDYHPNGSISSSESADCKTLFYQREETSINATRTVGNDKETTTSLLSEPGRILGSRGAERKSSAYFVELLGSIALQLSGPDGVQAVEYDAYGNIKSFTGTPPGSHSFGYRQELTDNRTGLVYLRSRFYQPAHGSFLTMDTLTTKENRYSYCAGDPINLADSTGHCEGWAWVVGLVVGAAIGWAISGPLALKLFGEAMGAWKTIAVAAAAGSVGTVVGDATEALITWQGESFMQVVQDAVMGAVIGVAELGIAAVVKRAYPALRATTVGAIAGTAAGVLTGLTASAVTGQSLLSFQNILGVAVGAAAGALGTRFGAAAEGRGRAQGHEAPVVAAQTRRTESIEMTNQARNRANPGERPPEKQERYDGDLEFLAEIIFPYYTFNYASGFQEATHDLVYEAFELTKERNPPRTSSFTSFRGSFSNRTPRGAASATYYTTASLPKFPNFSVRPGANVGKIPSTAIFRELDGVNVRPLENTAVSVTSSIVLPG